MEAEDISYEVWVPRSGNTKELGMIGSFNTVKEAEFYVRRYAKSYDWPNPFLGFCRIKEVHMIRKEFGEWVP